MLGDKVAVIGKYVAFDYEKLTVTNAVALGFTASKYLVKPRPIRIIVTCETAPCRYRYDGTDPTTTEGHLFVPTYSLVVDGYKTISTIKFIATTATDAILRCSFER